MIGQAKQQCNDTPINIITEIFDDTIAIAHKMIKNDQPLFSYKRLDGIFFGKCNKENTKAVQLRNQPRIEDFFKSQKSRTLPIAQGDSSPHTSQSSDDSTGTRVIHSDGSQSNSPASNTDDEDTTRRSRPRLDDATIRASAPTPLLSLYTRLAELKRSTSALSSSSSSLFPRSSSTSSSPSSPTEQIELAKIMNSQPNKKHPRTSASCFTFHALQKTTPLISTPTGELARLTVADRSLSKTPSPMPRELPVMIDLISPETKTLSSPTARRAAPTSSRLDESQSALLRPKML